MLLVADKIESNYLEQTQYKHIFSVCLYLPDYKGSSLVLRWTPIELPLGSRIIFVHVKNHQASPYKGWVILFRDL